MTPAILKSLAASAAAGALLAGSAVRFYRGRALGSGLELIGAAGLAGVALSHLFEAAGLFSWMGWGLERSAGHYFDLGCAVLGLSLFPLGFLLETLSAPRR